MIIKLDNIDFELQKKDILECLSDGFGDTIPSDMFFEKYSKESEHHFTFGKFLKTELVSLLTVLIEPKLIHNGSFVAHIEDVCTKEEFRNEGYSTQLINHACNWAKEQGCYKVILDSKLEGFYEKLGFNVVEKCYRKDL